MAMQSEYQLYKAMNAKPTYWKPTVALPYMVKVNEEGPPLAYLF